MPGAEGLWAEHSLVRERAVSVRYSGVACRGSNALRSGVTARPCPQPGQVSLGLRIPGRKPGSQWGESPLRPRSLSWVLRMGVECLTAACPLHDADWSAGVVSPPALRLVMIPMDTRQEVPRIGRATRKAGIR